MLYGSLGDDVLVELVGRGRPEAFEPLFRRHHQNIRRFCRSMLHDHQLADDCAQRTMIRAYTAMSGGQKPRNVRAWLYRIAYNDTVDETRRRRWEPLDENLPAILQSPHDEASTRESMAALTESIAALPPARRSAIVMREMGGLSHAEIATAMDVTPAAARSLISEARRSLRRDRERGSWTWLPLPALKVAAFGLVAASVVGGAVVITPYDDETTTQERHHGEAAPAVFRGAHGQPAPVQRHTVAHSHTSSPPVATPARPPPRAQHTPSTPATGPPQLAPATPAPPVAAPSATVPTTVVPPVPQITPILPVAPPTVTTPTVTTPPLLVVPPVTVTVPTVTVPPLP